MGASLIAQSVKNLPAMQETTVSSLGGEEPLENERATHSSIFAWRIPWTEEHICGSDVVTKSCPSLVTPWTVAHQAPLNTQKTKIMASGPIALWEIDGETVETVSDFILRSSKIIADSDCSHEIKRRLLLGRKVMTNLDSIFKSRDITLPTMVHLVKGMIFPVVM